MDAALRPAWVFEMLRLWQPHHPVSMYMEQALDLTAQELASLKTRRRTLNQIVRIFVASRGRGPMRRTLAQNVWAAYCRGYRPHLLAPAFLTHVVASVDLAQAVGEFFQEHDSPGTVFTTAQVRACLAHRARERRFSPGSVSVWLRTLAHFHVLIPAAYVGTYEVRRPLPIGAGIFPLLVYSWAQVRQTVCVDPEDFAADPILAYVDRGGFDHYWRLYAGLLWTAGTRDVVQGTGQRHCWRLRYLDGDSFERALVNLLTTYRRPRRYDRTLRRRGAASSRPKYLATELSR